MKHGAISCRKTRSRRSRSSAPKPRSPWSAMVSTTPPPWRRRPSGSRWGPGSDVALETTADVALMADDLAHLPFAVGLSRSTRWVIRQNVFVEPGRGRLPRAGDDTRPWYRACGRDARGVDAAGRVQRSPTAWLSRSGEEGRMKSQRPSFADFTSIVQRTAFSPSPGCSRRPSIVSRL